MEKKVFNSLEEVCVDNYFIEWVLNPSEEHHHFWKEWMIEHPQQAYWLEEARTIVLQLHHQAAPDFNANEGWKNLKQELQFDAKIKALPKRKKFSWTKIAAAIAILIASLIALYLFFPSNMPSEYRTAHGEQLEVILKDKTKVYLNANSSLKVEKWEKERRVKLEGEAYFDVAKKNKPFVIQTAEMEVVVLGTKFNLTARPNRSRLALDEGKVALNVKENLQDTSLQIKPGQIAEIVETKPVKVVERNTEAYSSWREGILTFEQTKLKELAAIINDNFGYKVSIADSMLLNKTLEGSIPSNDIETLLTGIEIAFKLNIEKTGERNIVIKSE